MAERKLDAINQALRLKSGGKFDVARSSVISRKRLPYSLGVMASVRLPTPSQWGNGSVRATPAEIIEALANEARQAILAYTALPEGREPCDNQEGYFRASVEIPLSQALFDQLMNGPTGYRAHYSVAVEVGEDFNRRLVEAVAPLFVDAERLYADKFDAVFCQRSLLGPFSKFWYPKLLTDPSAQSQLLKLKEELRSPRWVKYWRARPKPRKGLLAPLPENTSVLLNGTFVNDAGEVYEQKPGRSKELFETGWV
jgi:hypothetical protein